MAVVCGAVAHFVHPQPPPALQARALRRRPPMTRAPPPPTGHEVVTSSFARPLADGHFTCFEAVGTHDEAEACARDGSYFLAPLASRHRRRAMLSLVTALGVAATVYALPRHRFSIARDMSRDVVQGDALGTDGCSAKCDLLNQSVQCRFLVNWAASFQFDGPDECLKACTVAGLSGVLAPCRVGSWRGAFAVLRA